MKRVRWDAAHADAHYVLRLGGIVTDPDFAPGKSEELFRGYFAPQTESNPGRTYEVTS